MVEDDDYYDDYNEWSDPASNDKNWREPPNDPARFELSRNVVPNVRIKIVAGMGIVVICLLVVGLFHSGHSKQSQPPRMAIAQSAMATSANQDDFVATPEPGVPVASSVPASDTGATTPDTGVAARDAAPPLPDTTGNDLGHVTNELFRFKYWLDQHPDMTLLPQLYAPGSPALNHFSQDMQTLVAQHTTGTQPQATILNVNVLLQSAKMAEVQAHTQYGASQAFDETLTLIRSGTGNWQISDWVVA